MKSPRNTRNFWITTEVDGCRTTSATGPRSKDGGFTTRVYQRKNGKIIQGAIVTGRAHECGQLELTVYVADKEYTFVTKR